jgi:hypothetical protein
MFYIEFTNASTDDVRFVALAFVQVFHATPYPYMGYMEIHRVNGFVSHSVFTGISWSSA